MEKYVFAYILQQLKTDFLDPYSYILGHIVLIKGWENERIALIEWRASTHPGKTLSLILITLFYLKIKLKKKFSQ